ncbi:MAG: rhomboid family intramembrane serine protease [Gemmatimonadales bacterium]
MTRWVGVLIIANLAAFVWRLQFPEHAAALAFVPSLALLRPWTVITYMFLHSGFGHILFNMLGLYFFGPRVEERVGAWRFLTLYFISGLTGAAASMVFSPRAPIIGASAAVFGVLLAFARFWPRAQLLVWGVVPVEARVMIVIMTVLALAGGVGLGRQNVAHFAHLGGFVGGWLVLRGYGMRPGEDRIRPAARAAATRSAPDAASAERWKRIALDQLHPVNREEIVRVLAKLDTEGAESLTADERHFLDRFSAT